MADTAIDGETKPEAKPHSPTTSKEQPPALFASYVPHDLQYSQTFEDDLVTIVLDEYGNQEGSKNHGLRIIPSGSDEQAEPGISVRADTIDPQSLPTVNEDELPLPLGDNRRLYASPISGIRLTHPGGYLEGGPGLDAEMDTFPDDFLSNHADAITSPETLRSAIDDEIALSVELLRERLRARQRAREKNEQIERDIKVLTDQHSMELRIQSRMAEERKKKKEAKEMKKRED